MALSTAPLMRGVHILHHMNNGGFVHCARRLGVAALTWSTAYVERMVFFQRHGRHTIPLLTRADGQNRRRTSDVLRRAHVDQARVDLHGGDDNSNVRAGLLFGTLSRRRICGNPGWRMPRGYVRTALVLHTEGAGAGQEHVFSCRAQP